MAFFEGFLGQHTHSVDEKGRVAVPNSFRRKLSPACEGRLILLRGRDRTIEVHPLSDWDEFVNRTLRKLPLYQPKAQRILRYRYASATEVGLDGQGRILLPKHLREESGIDNEAVLAGAGDYFEIWNPGRLQAFLREAGETYDADLVELERQGWGGIPDDDNGSAGKGVPPAGDGQ